MDNNYDKYYDSFLSSDTGSILSIKEVFLFFNIGLSSLVFPSVFPSIPSSVATWMFLCHHLLVVKLSSSASDLFRRSILLHRSNPIFSQRDLKEFLQSTDMITTNKIAMRTIENMDIPTIDAVPIVGLWLLLHEELLPNNWDSLCKQVIVYNHTCR